MTTLAGVLHLVVNGTQYKTAETANYSIATRTQESILGAARHGVAIKGAAAFIEVVVFLDEGQASAALVGLRGAEVQLVLIDRTVTLAAADFVSDGQVDASNNSLTVRFESASGREVS